jgi:hypothetical protein
MPIEDDLPTTDHTPGRGSSPNERGKSSERGRGNSKGSSSSNSTPSASVGDDFNVVPLTPSTAVPGTFEAIATPLRDKLTGETTGISTLFLWENLRDSLLKGAGGGPLWDVVDGYTSGVDILYAPQNITTTSIDRASGSISKLNAGQINAKALGGKSFQANSAAAFTCKGYDGTFVVFNDGLKGYQQNSDTLIFLQGFNLASGPLTVF